jgi:peptidoglycan/xylan/chitin deacetylase (PgdA/CDA1 family)
MTHAGIDDPPGSQRRKLPHSPGEMVLDVARRTIARSLHPRVVRGKSPVGMLSICFDDFPKTAWTEGGRVLADHDVRATYYVCGGLSGSIFEGERMYDESDLEPIHAAGHEIGCHTYDHRSCLRSTPLEFERSTVQNQRFLNERLGDVRFSSFAYPYGHTTWTSKRYAVRRYASARGVDASLNESALDIGQLKAVGLEAEKQRLPAIERYIERAATTRGWLIVYTHDVQDRPGPYGCRPGELDRLIRSARSAGLEILPVKNALTRRTGAGAFTSAG